MIRDDLVTLMIGNHGGFQFPGHTTRHWPRGVHLAPSFSESRAEIVLASAFRDWAEIIQTGPATISEQNASSPDSGDTGRKIGTLRLSEIGS